MERKETFLHAFNALTRAYLNETLTHGSCRRCAVGNIVQQHNSPVHDWYSLLCMYRGKPQHLLNNSSICGYEMSEISKIEAAFEKEAWGDPDGYKGLLAVLGVLFDIHKVEQQEGEPLRSAFLKEEVTTA